VKHRGKKLLSGLISYSEHIVILLNVRPLLPANQQGEGTQNQPPPPGGSLSASVGGSARIDHPSTDNGISRNLVNLGACDQASYLKAGRVDLESYWRGIIQALNASQVFYIHSNGLESLRRSAL